VHHRAYTFPIRITAGNWLHDRRSRRNRRTCNSHSRKFEHVAPRKNRPVVVWRSVFVSSISHAFPFLGHSAVASTCSTMVAQIGSILVMRLCHFQSHIPENSIKSLLARRDIHPSKLPPQPPTYGASCYHRDTHLLFLFIYAPTRGARVPIFLCFNVCWRKFDKLLCRQPNGGSAQH
jgi:hypothetical protein